MKTTRQIVFLMTDTQRTDMLGCYGNPAMRTPSLDRLASQGIRFDRAYTCQPVCGPARSAIFTGTYPHTNGSWANSMALGDNVWTIGQRLRDQGFRTAYVGKWHLDGGDYFGTGRCPDGWDPAYWYDMRRYLEELTPEQRAWSRRMETNADPSLKAELTFGHRCSNRAIDFLAKHHGERFFLVVSYDEPHGPCLAPRPFSQMHQGVALPSPANARDSLPNKPEHQRVWAELLKNVNRDELAQAWAWLLGCNSFVDHEIGRVLEAVERYVPDALVIYTSDHGDFMRSHGLGGKGPAMYDEITRVPLIVRWPGVARANAACGHPVSHVDLAPTILDAAGLPIPKSLEGRSQRDALADPGVRINDAIFLEFGRYEVDHDGFGGFQPIRCALDGRYKLVVNLLTTDELYDLREDPEEMVNRIDDRGLAAVRNRLHDALLEWMNRTRDPFRGYYWERRPWRTDARPATWGYTGMTRQRENEEYEPRQLDYDTGLEMKEAVRRK